VNNLTAQDSTKSYLWGLIQIKQTQEIEVEDGYWKDRILRGREFHEPIRFIPFEVRYGFGYNGGAGIAGISVHENFMQYGSPVTKFDGGELTARVGHQLDIDFAKTNLSLYLLHSSWIDMHTGLNIRYSNVFLPAELPVEDWGNSNPSWNPGVRKFAPKTWTYSVSQSVILQWFEPWYLNLNYTFGIATATFHQTTEKEIEATPSGWGPSSSYSAGIRVLLNQTASDSRQNKFNIGIDLKHSYTKISNINDPADITPISSFYLSNFGVFVTFSALYGGSKTVGDLGKKYYYRKDYQQAAEKLKQFVELYPNHANLYRAEYLIKESERKLPTQLLKEGQKFEERNMTDRALEKYLKARVFADSTFKPFVDDHIRKIAEARLDAAELVLHSGQGEKAIEMVHDISQYYSKVDSVIPEFEAYHLYYQASKAIQYNFYDKALILLKQADKKDPSLHYGIDLLRQEIAGSLIENANKITDLKAINLVVQYLEKAKNITGTLGRNNERILDELKEKLTTKENLVLQSKIDARMIQERKNLEEKAAKPTIRIGMNTSLVKNIMGEPREMIEQSKDGANHQLWKYRFENRKPLELSFIDYILFKIEER
jgi:tetratricopeptide (TPR) repeat protein